MVARLRPVERRAFVLVMIAALIGLPSFGPWPLITTAVANSLFELACSRLPFLRRPENALAAVWVVGQTLLGLGVALAGGGHLYLLSTLSYPVVLVAVVFPVRVLLPAAVLTVAEMVAIALGTSAGTVAASPPVLAYPVVITIVSTIGASLARSRDVHVRGLAFVDRLTGLLNRSALSSRAGELAHRARATGQRVAVIVCDVDRFKAINDEHGHARGDAVLAAVARRLAGCLGAEESIFRLGGEEFVTLLALTGDAADAEAEALAAAERMCAAVRDTRVEGLAVTVSCGVAVSPAGAFAFETVFAVADTALYRAKDQGRDRACAATAVAATPGPRAVPTDTDRRRLRPAPGAPAGRRSDERVHEIATGGNWLVRDEQERDHLLELARRTRVYLLLVMYPLAVASMLTAVPQFGTTMLIAPLIGGTVLTTISLTLERFRRPELALAGGWLAAQLGAAGGWIGVHGSPSVALPMLSLLVAIFSPVFRGRAVAAGTLLSGALIVFVTALTDPDVLAGQPGLVANALALTGAVALIGGAVGRSTLDHLGAGVVDPLTGTLNRTALDVRVAELARPAAAPAEIAVLVVDLDHFKTVNDRHGHATGDAVLQEVAYRLRAALRTFDAVYRVGGEEFVAVLPAGADEAAAIAERLRVAVSAEPVHGLDVRVSIGVSVTDAGRRFEYGPAFAAADAALYAAKRGGRDRVCFAA